MESAPPVQSRRVRASRRGCVGATVCAAGAAAMILASMSTLAGRHSARAQQGPSAPAGPALPPQLPPQPPPEPTDAEGEPTPLPYRVRLIGADGAGDLGGLIRDASTLFRLSDRPVESLAILRRRADADVDRVARALRSLGYYDGVVAIDVEPPSGIPVPDAATLPVSIVPDEAAPPVAAVTADGSASVAGPAAMVTIGITPGPRYRLAQVEIVSADGTLLPLDPPKPGRADIGLPGNAPAVAADIIAAERAIRQHYENAGYAYAEVVDRVAIVDHATDTMALTYVVDAGPLVRLGPALVSGLERVDEGLVRGRLTWATGDVYDPAEIALTRARLRELGVFTSASAVLPDDRPMPGPDGAAVAPVIVTVTEQPRRFIGGGVRFSTSEGLGGRAFWGHRNLLGGGEQLRIDAEVSNILGTAIDRESDTTADISAQLGASFRKPDVLRVRQSLVSTILLEREREEGFEREGGTFTLGLERQVSDRLTVGAGGLLEFSSSRTIATDRSVDTILVGLPLTLSVDGSNDLLNPTQGFRAAASFTPFVGADTGAVFAITRLTGSVYRGFGGGRRFVAAARASVGGIVGGDVETDIPANRLFFVGGGGSVRGYGFQQAGRLDEEGDPIGGRSLFEAGLELRIRVSENIGLVPFLDAGTVASTDLPSFAEGIRLGAGVGLRYFTPIGPIRLDVAVPVDRREDDSAFEFYISIGQAF